MSCKFNIGDVVQINMKPDKFRNKALRYDSTNDYVHHLADGGTAIVEEFRHDKEHVVLRIPGKRISNWFRTEWLELANNELSAIKRESKRL